MEVNLAQHPGNFSGGNIKYFISVWRQFSSDPFYDKFLLGDFLEFIDSPPTASPPPKLRLPPSDQLALDVAIKEFSTETRVHKVLRWMVRYDMLKYRWIIHQL